MCMDDDALNCFESELLVYSGQQLRRQMMLIDNGRWTPHYHLVFCLRNAILLNRRCAYSTIRTRCTA